MKIKFIKDYIGIHNRKVSAGSEETVQPYEHYFRGWKRTSDGIYHNPKDGLSYIVICYGQGEFETLPIGILVEI